MKVDPIILEIILEQTLLKQDKEVNKDAIVEHQQEVNILKQQVQYQDNIKILCVQVSKKYRTEHVKFQLKKKIHQVKGSHIKHIHKQDWPLVLHN